MFFTLFLSRSPFGSWSVWNPDDRLCCGTPEINERLYVPIRKKCPLSIYIEWKEGIFCVPSGPISGRGRQYIVPNSGQPNGSGPPKTFQKSLQYGCRRLKITLRRRARGNVQLSGWILAFTSRSRKTGPKPVAITIFPMSKGIKGITQTRRARSNVACVCTQNITVPRA